MTKKLSKPNEVQVHISKATEKMESAGMLLEKGFIDDAVSRAYYATFHAIVAMLRKHGVTLDIHKHAYILNQFKIQFIDKGLFPEWMFFKMQQVKQVREQADYSAVVMIDKEKARRLLADAKEIVGLITDRLEQESN